MQQQHPSDDDGHTTKQQLSLSSVSNSGTRRSPSSSSGISCCCPPATGVVRGATSVCGANNEESGNESGICPVCGGRDQSGTTTKTTTQGSGASDCGTEETLKPTKLKTGSTKRADSSRHSLSQEQSRSTTPIPQPPPLFLQTSNSIASRLTELDRNNTISNSTKSCCACEECILERQRAQQQQEQQNIGGSGAMAGGGRSSGPYMGYGGGGTASAAALVSAAAAATGHGSSGPTTSSSSAASNATMQMLYCNGPSTMAAQTIEEQIKQIDRISKECDNSRKCLEAINRRLDDLNDEVRRYREFLGHEKTRRDPSLHQTYKTNTAEPLSVYNEGICRLIDSLTTQLTLEWTEKLRSIQNQTIAKFSNDKG